jgi:hypothetical protein
LVPDVAGRGRGERRRDLAFLSFRCTAGIDDRNQTGPEDPQQRQHAAADEQIHHRVRPAGGLASAACRAVVVVVVIVVASARRLADRTVVAAGTGRGRPADACTTRGAGNLP